MSEEVTLPIRYSLSSFDVKQIAEKKYFELQDGLCYYCHGKLTEPPVKDEYFAPLVQRVLDSGMIFPKNFLTLFPIHLHHDHKTDLTLGVVHPYCNAALWVIEAE